MAEDAEKTLFKGAPVKVRGLQNAAEWNGSKGTVTAGPFDNGRYEVSLPVEGGTEPKVLSLKPGNIQLDTEALAEYLSMRRQEQPKRQPPLQDVSVLWTKRKGLGPKALTMKSTEVGTLDKGDVLLRIDKFAFSHMALGYLMKGFTRTFSAYHNFFQHPDEDHYRSACWGYATVVESNHPQVSIGTRLYGLVPPSKYIIQRILRTIPAGKGGEPPIVEFQMEGVPFNLRRFQEYEVIEPNTDDEDPSFEDWKIATKEIYTMAFYMDENLLVDTGMINAVAISCASSKTAIALAYCLRMREMRYVVGLTSESHVEFVKDLGVYHEVLEYSQMDQLPNNHTLVYMDFKCDGSLRQAITARMGTNLMYTMTIGPSVFQQKPKDQVFEKRARDIMFDESTWRERRRQVAEVTKTGRNEKLKYSYKAFVQRMKQWSHLRHVHGVDAFRATYEQVFDNSAPRDEVYICDLHQDPAEEKKDFSVDEFFPGSA